ncbi:MAG TPA: sodium-dependent transporter [Candidatus Saccharicenans sp.]|nr:sodium-dependent transporter [Candidatus Saccharicenans sp.]HQM74012.1 sodium-dependent transporter [Candidatus Saccharicenans sp.]
MAGQNDNWSSRVGFILASMGMAFGAGNIWRFPRVVAANDGGPFLIAFFVATIVWAVPMLMIEMIMGKTTRQGTIGAFKKFVGPRSTWMGAWIGFCCIFIMFYYSVVTGWAIRYLTYGVTGVIRKGIDSEALWKHFTGSPEQTILFHFIAIGIAAFIIIGGVQKGLERANKIIVPSIIVLLAILMVWVLTKPHAVEGLEYLFRPNLAGLLKAKVWLNAFTQAAWSVGAGWGLMLTYAVYMSDRDDIGANSFVIALADAGSSLLAAMGILPLVFAVSPSRDVALQALQSGDTGLTFIYLAKFFPNLPAGSLLAGLFFLALAISALASLLSMVELAVLNLGDFGINRRKAALITAAVAFILGIPSAWNISFQDNQDMVWGVGLLISGIFFAYAVYKNGIDNVRGMINESSWIHVGKWFNWCVIAIPVIFIIIFGWWVFQAVTWYPDSWWNPWKKLSPGTMVLQWSLLIIAVILLNKWFSQKIRLTETDLPDEIKEKN